MCPDLTDLAALIRCLQDEADRNGGRFIDLGPGLFAAAGTLAGYLDPAAPLRVEKAEGEALVQPGEGEVRVVGTATLFAGRVAHAVRVAGTVPAPNDVRLRLEATPADEKGWSLGTAFPDLPDYFGLKDAPREPAALVAGGADGGGDAAGGSSVAPEARRADPAPGNGMKVTGPELVWLPSFFGDTVLTPSGEGAPLWTAATFKENETAPGLRLRARLDAGKGTLGKRVGPYLPAGDRAELPLEGAVQVREGTFPLLRLAAPIRALTIPRLGTVSLVLSTRDAAAGDEAQSIAELDGAVRVGELPALHVAGPVLQGDTAWALTVSVDDPERYTLGAGLKALATFAGVPNLTLPAGLDAFTSFYLASVTVGVSPREGLAAPSLLGVSVRSGARWTLPLPGLSVGDIQTGWEVVGPFADRPVVTGSVTGTVFLGEGEKAPRLDVDVDLTGLTGPTAPSVTLEAGLLVVDPVEHPLRVDRLFNQFTGLSLDLDLRVSALNLQAETGARTFVFSALLENRWQPLAPLFTFRSLALDFSYAPNEWTGSLAGRLALSTLEFQVTAAYRGAARGWRFSGSLVPGVRFVPPAPRLALSGGGAEGSLAPAVVRDAASERTLKAFLVNLSPRFGSLPDSIGNIELISLSAWWETKTGEFGFETVVGWRYEIEGIRLAPEAEFVLNRGKGKTDALEYSGRVRGTLRVNDFAVSVIYDFAVENNRTFTFQLAYRQAVITAVLSKNAKGETLLRAGLGGVSFGDVVEYLVGLVDPASGFRLPAPWDVLYGLRFDDLKLEVNFTTKTVGIRYEPRVNLGIVRVDALSLTYVRRAGRSTVDISIEGEFLGAEYGEKNPLAWDLLNDPPPAPPGKGEQLLDLRYLGLGQNVTFRETKSFRRVRDVIDALEADFAEVEGDENPLVSLPDLKFSGDGSWLVGADFTVMSAVSLSGVFNDPVLYGVRIGLAGPRVKALAGLEFEILYKKVTDTIGVYSIELTLPEAMRQFFFGAVAVTVPVVSLDIYTNGNFRVDLGFPANRDFSRGFCVQAGPFIGYGGFYFALLEGATSSVVPRIRNGSFAPVVELGIGLSVGVGRTIEKGVLSAGATLTVEAIVEGALGWFNPDDRSQPGDVYYRVQGTAAIVGKLFGRVDFVVVKVAVSVTAYAAVTLTVESFAPIQVRLELGVEVSASLTILFIEVSFSFQMKLDLSFQIGERTQAPWLLAAEAPEAHPLRLGGQRRRHRPAPVRPLELFRMVRERTGEQPVFDWSPRALFAGGAPVDVAVLLVPSLTPAIPSRVTHALRAPLGFAPAGEPAVQVVMSMLVPTSVPAGALHAEEVARVEAAAPADAAFNRLAAGMLRWAVSSLRTAPDAHVFRAAPADEGESVSAAALEAIGCFLADRANREATFTYARVTGVIERNFVLRVGNPIGPTGAFHDPGSDVARAHDAPPLRGAVFPMIPEVRMAPAGQPAVEFWRHACADQAYRNALATYYDQLAPEAPTGGHDPFRRDPCPRPGPAGPASSAPLRAAPLPEGCAPGREPLSAILFADWFGMVTQQAVQAASEMLAAYPYEPTGAETLLELSRRFGGFRAEYATRPGDTPGTVAARFGVSVAEVRRHNGPWLAALHPAERLPQGSVLAVETGPTVARTAEANADYPLRPRAALTVRDVRYAVQSGDTLAGVARAFALSGPEALVDGVNAGNAALPRAGARLPVPAADYRVEEDDRVAPGQAVDRIAARQFVRAGLRRADAEAAERIAWYASAIADRNRGGFAGTIQIPVATLAGEPPQLRDTGTITTYVVNATDTVATVAAMFELLQLSAADPAWREFRGRVTVSPPPAGTDDPPAGSTVHLPSFACLLRAGDTFASVARTFLAPRAEAAPPQAVQALARAAGAAAVLAPRAVLALPPLRYTVAEGDTLASVAARFDQTVEELAHGAENDPGILSPYVPGGRRMVVPDVATRAVDALVEDLARFGRFNTLSSTVSRFALSGMRAPVPPRGLADGGGFAEGEALWGVYDVAGQQFPAPSPSGPSGPYDIEFAKAPGSTAAWFCFEPPAGQRAAAGPRGCADGVTVRLPEGFFQRHRPSTELDPMLATGPAPLRLYDLVAPRHALEQAVPWQPAARVPLPGPTAGPTGASGQVTGAAGSPSVWLFPRTLLRDLGPVGLTAGTPPYELLAAREAQGGGTAETPLSRYAWGMAVPLRITRALDESGGFVPATYTLGGADQDGRDRLLNAWRYLAAAPARADRLYLLYRPGAGAGDGNGSGLVSDALSTGRTLLLKTNLSTETHSSVMLAAGAALDYSAPLGSPGAFLRFAWEASITGTGGFHLSYAAADGTALPDELFAADGAATLWAVLLPGRQSDPGTPERALFPFNNCAVLAENLDAAAVRVVARLRDPAPGQRVRVAAVPPGVVGFGLARLNPSGPSGPQGPTGLTERLHSLVGYQVRGNADFAESHEGLPVSPLDAQPAWMRLPPRGPHAYWTYEQVIPIARFGAVNDCPRSPALPDAERNPYRGVTGPWRGGGRPLSSAKVELAYLDVYGNETRATRPLPALELPVGYTDDLVGVAAWPGAAFDYRFTPGLQGGILLQTALSLQADRYLPGAEAGYEAAVRAAGADAERYAGVYYQVQQRDVSFALASTVGAPRVDDPGVLKAPLLSFVTRARVFAQAAGTLRQRTHTTAGGQTLAALAQVLAVTPGALAAANRDADATAVFPATWVRPHLVPAPASRTLQALAEEVGARRTGFVPGADPCAGVEDADAAARPPALRLALRGEEARSFRAAPRLAAGPPDPGAVAADNAAQPLTPGLVLRTLARVSPPLDFTTVTNSLDGVAGFLGCSVLALVPNPDAPDGDPLEVGLLVQSWTMAGLVAGGVVIEVEGATYTTTADDTFEGIYTALLAQRSGLTHGDFARGIRGVRGIFVPGAAPAYADLVVPQPAPSPLPGPAAPVFALRDVPAQAGTPRELAALNRATPGFFFLGSPLLLGFDCCKAAEGDTLGTLAHDAAITLEQLAAYNAGVEVGAGVQMDVPGLVHLPDPDAVWAAYTPGAADSLATAAAVLGTDARRLAAVNRQLPGIFAPGARVRIGGAELGALPLDSLESLWRRFGGDGAFEAFVDALAAQVGIYAPTGTLVGPLPAVPGGEGGQSPPLEAVAAGLNVDPAALLQANRALAGLLREGAVILGPGVPGGEAPRVTVGAFDTVETVRRRLRDGRGPGAPAPTDAQLVEANRGVPGLLSVGARLLLPPNPIPFEVGFTARIPDGAGKDGLVFPVEVTVAMTREPGLVHPDFRDAPAVRRAESRLAPRIAGAQGAAGLALTSFAQSFEAAFENPFRLKCAVPAGAERAADGPGQVLAVNFGPSGIRRLEVDAAHPRFYALRPLSTETVGGEVRIPVYTSGSGLCGDVVKRFEGVDLDVWMRQLLETVDLYLTPPYSVPSFRLGLTGAAGPAFAHPGGANSVESTLLSSGADSVETARLFAGADSVLPPLSTVGPVGLASGPAPVIFARDPGSALGASGCTGPAPSGPADFDRVVGAKQALAAALRRNVVPVLHQPGATGPVELEAAREALYQQMLVRLGNAYDVSAVVQFPVRVDSPVPVPTRPGGPYPPRASGKVVPATYTLPSPAFGAAGPPRQPAFARAAPRAGDAPPVESYAAVAAVFGVAAPFLAQVTGGMQGLLNPAATIDGERVLPDDTLNRIAARRGVPTNPAEAGYWEKWQAFVARFATRPVFLPRAAFSLSRVARTVDAGDTLTTFAEFFGRGVDSVARANQGLIGILRPGELRLSDFPIPYAVKETDTLEDVAHGLSVANGRALDVDGLARRLRDQPGVLRPGAVLRMADPLPEMSLSTARVNLGPVGASGGPPPPLSFLLTVKQVAERDKLLLNLDYAINEIEYDIRDVPGAGAYQASRWLSLVLPLDGSRGGIRAGVRTDIPQVQVPIPLRAYPPPSILPSQSGAASHPDAGDFAAARRWDYRFDVQTRQAAQDTAHLRVQFGEPRGVGAFAAPIRELFRWLAAFADAYPLLKDDLARLPALAPGAADPVAAHAVLALSLLARNVAGALASTSLLAAGAGEAADTFRYRMTTLADAGMLVTLRLDPEDTGPGFRLAAAEGPPGVTESWPRVFVRKGSEGGQGAGDDPEPGFVELGERDGGSYRFPDGFQADQALTYRFRFDERDVIRNDTGRGAIAVSRNDRLVAHGPLGPTGPGAPVPTAADFIYQTPFVAFADPAVPLIDNDAPIDVSGGAAPRPLRDHLLELLRRATDVAPGAGARPRTIEMLASYGFPLGGDADAPLIATTPVRLVPSRSIAPGDVGAFADDLAASLNDWHRATGVEGGDGRLVFSLTVFAGGGDEGSLPILRFRNLQLPVRAILWDGAPLQG